MSTHHEIMTSLSKFLKVKQHSYSGITIIIGDRRLKF